MEDSTTRTATRQRAIRDVVCRLALECRPCAELCVKAFDVIQILKNSSLRPRDTLEIRRRCRSARHERHSERPPRLAAALRIILQQLRHLSIARLLRERLGRPSIQIEQAAIGAFEQQAASGAGSELELVRLPARRGGRDAVQRGPPVLLVRCVDLRRAGTTTAGSQVRLPACCHQVSPRRRSAERARSSQGCPRSQRNGSAASPRPSAKRRRHPAPSTRCSPARKTKTSQARRLSESTVRTERLTMIEPCRRAAQNALCRLSPRGEREPPTSAVAGAVSDAGTSCCSPGSGSGSGCWTDRATNARSTYFARMKRSAASRGAPGFGLGVLPASSSVDSQTRLEAALPTAALQGTRRIIERDVLVAERQESGQLTLARAATQTTRACRAPMT